MEKNSKGWAWPSLKHSIKVIKTRWSMQVGGAIRRREESPETCPVPVSRASHDKGQHVELDNNRLIAAG